MLCTFKKIFLGNIFFLMKEDDVFERFFHHFLKKKVEKNF
jgi:hypothetical protein